MIPLPANNPRKAVTRDAANHVLYHFGYGGYPAGSFFRALLEAWDRADRINTQKLAEAFPVHGAALAILGVDHTGVDQLRKIAEDGEPT